MRYEVNHNNWRGNEEWASEMGAVDCVRREYGADVVIQDDWDCDGYDEDGKQVSRKLVWASKEDADQDAGANALCEIRRVPKAGDEKPYLPCWHCEGSEEIDGEECEYCDGTGDAKDD